jgi:methylthioribose-1-phosphate isomerase
MNVNGKAFRTIWLKPGDEKIIQIIDQRYLPHRFIIEDLETVDQMAAAIKDMHLRGAGLIGAAAGFGMYLATLEASKDNAFDQYVLKAAEQLKSTRPTAVNLAWALNKQLHAIQHVNTMPEKINIALAVAKEIADEDAEYCRRIGEHGLKIIEAISATKNGDTVNILTHCNAGWLAFVDYGSASSPIYAAHNKGINVHVWIDETRPRNQGAGLTAWEMAQHGVPNTIIADNTGGHLMQHGMVDMVIVGSDRTTYTGDVANKIGTYLKALAAHDNNIPFYAALPSSSIDWQMEDGLKEIVIEERNGDEVKYIEGLCDGEIKKVLLTPVNSKAANYAFDVTPARLVTGIITERGICEPNKQSILTMFPEKNNIDEIR